LAPWAPLENANVLELWYRDKEDDVGQSIEYHAAVLLITQNYFDDKEVQKREFSRFIEFVGRQRGLFWIPIEDTVYEMTELGRRNIAPAWGFEGGGSPLSTVVALSERQYGTVWKNVAIRIVDWWKESGSKLGDKLEDTRVNNRIVVEPKSQFFLRSQLAVNDRAQLLRILPCLINREQQERPLSKRVASNPPAKPGKIVFVLPAPREERADRFADRLDSYTIGTMRAKGALQGNIEFCRIGWPSYAEGETGRSLFEEYLDAVFKSMRLDLNCDSAKNVDDYMNEAAALLKPRMRDTRFVFWSEIAAGKSGQTTKELLATVLAWWQRFDLAPGPNDDFLVPIAVLAPATTKERLAAYLPDGPHPNHLEVLTELSPIGFQDMLNWLTLSEVRGFDSAGSFRCKIDGLYPRGDERISFAALETDVVKWLAEK
jgi:hypothetical protein